VSATVVPGTPARWLTPAETRIVVENLGDGATSGPTTVVVQNGAGSDGRLEGVGWTCGPLQQPYRTGTCVRDASLASGERAPDIRLVATTDNTNNSASIGGTFRVSASVSTPEDGRTGGSFADRPVVRDAQADATLVVDAAEPAPRSAVRAYRVRVGNRGTAATGFPLRVVLGSDGSAPDASGDGWICERATRTCLLATPLEPGASAPVLAVRSAPGDPTSTLRAQVFDPARAPGATDINDAAATPAVLTPDRKVDLAVAAGPLPGERNALSVDVRNAGDDPTSGPVSVAIDRADGSNGEIGMASGTGWDCTSRYGRCTTSQVVAPGEALPRIALRFRPRSPGGEVQASTRATVTAAGDARAGNDTAVAARTIQPQDTTDLEVDLELPSSPTAGTTALSLVRVRNPGPFATARRVDVALRAPVGSTAAGVGWVCTRELRCSSAEGLDPGTAAPDLQVSTPIPAAPSTTRVAIGAAASAAGAGVSVDGETTTGTRAGDVTVALGPHPGLAAGTTSEVPVVVRTTGAVPVPGPITVRLETGLANRVSGDGWACGPFLRRARRCTHAGPLPAAGALPTLSWELTAPDPLPGPAGLATPVGGIRATVASPTGTDLDPDDNAASATPLAPAPMDPTVDLVGVWDGLVPSTPTRVGRVSFVVSNTLGRAVPGTVTVSPSGWRAESGDGWRCSGTCRYHGPVPAGGVLPALSGTVVPTRRSDTTDDLIANLYRPDGSQVAQYQASLPAARGPMPTLSLFFIGNTTLQPGASSTIYGLIDADRPVAGPAVLDLAPDPGVVVERVTGATCTTALRCVVTGSFAARRELSVTLRTATDAAGTLRLRSRLSAEGARPSDRTTVVLPRAAGGDLTSTLEGPPAADAFGKAQVLERIRNDGPEAIAGPVRTRVLGASTYEEAPGTSADGWECERFTGTCSFDGPTAPGASLPPLRRTVTVGGASGGTPYAVVSENGTGAADDSVEENSSAGTTMPVGAPPAARVAVALAARETPAPGAPTAFVARVRNVGDRATTEPVELAFGTSFVLPGGMVVSVPFFGGSVAFPDVPADDGSGWSCEATTQRCVLSGPLGPGDAAPPLPVARDVSPVGAPPGPAVQTASVVAGAGDTPLTPSASASVGAAERTAADVAVAIGSAAPAVVGRSMRHAVRVTNLGSATTTEPVEVEVTSARGQRVILSGRGWVCPEGGRVCRLDGDRLDAGDVAPPLDVEVPWDGSFPDDRGITATVTGDGGGVPTDNDRATAVALLRGDPRPDEIGVAFDGLEPTAPGGTVRGVLRVAHVGAGAPTGPVGVVVSGVDEARGDGWTCVAGSGARERRCDHDAPPGTGTSLPSISLESHGPADRWQASVITPAARYAAAAVTPSVGRRPTDLAVALTDGEPLREGDETTVVARVRNGGTRTLSGPVSVTLGAPANVSIDPSGTDWACDGRTCTTGRDVAADAALPELRVRIRPKGRDGGRAATITATVGPTDDATPVNDASTATIGVGAGRVDLAPAIASTDPLRPGRTTRTTIRVRNVGAGSTERRTTLVVGAPFGGTLAGSGWDCSDLRCVRDATVEPESDLPPVTLTATTPTDAPLTSVTTTAVVENAADGTSTDDRAAASRGVGAPDRSAPRPSTALAVGLPAQSGAPGDLVPVQVAILGPDVPDETPARTRVTLPDGLSFATVPVGDPVPALDGRTLAWDVPLPAGRAAAVWTVLARVDDDAAPGARRFTASSDSKAFAIPESAAATFVVTAPPEQPAPGEPGSGDETGGDGTGGDGTGGGSGSGGAGAGGAGSSGTPSSGGTPTTSGPAAGRPPQPDFAAAIAALLAGSAKPAAPSTAGTRRPQATPAPTVRLSSVRPPRTAALVRSGWTVRVRVGAASAVRATFAPDRRGARTLGVRPGTAIAAGRATVRRAGVARVVLRSPPGLRTRIRRATRVTGTLRVVATAGSAQGQAERQAIIRR
jgi:hypothetical protein